MSKRLKSQFDMALDCAESLINIYIYPGTHLFPFHTLKFPYTLIQALLVTMTVQGSVTVSGCHSTDDFLQKKNIFFCPKIFIFTCLTVTDGVCIFKIHVEVSELLFTTTSPRRPRGRV